MRGSGGGSGGGAPRLLEQPMAGSDADEEEPILVEKTGGNGLRALLLALLVAAAVAVTWVVTRHKYGSRPSCGAAPYDRTKRYQPPQVFEAQLDFHIPYISFSEPISVVADLGRGSVRLSYWHGADVYVYTNETDLAVVLVFDRLTCLRSNGSAPVALFPDAGLFTLLPETERAELFTRAYPNGVECDIWDYRYGHATHDPGANASATLPNSRGYVGHYQFFVSSADGSPVAFRARYGHNVVLGGSHYDEYQLDYLSVRELPYVDRAVFGPPAGMTCYENSVPVGPTRITLADGSQLTRAHAGRELKMMFPSGERARQDAYAAYRARHGKSYATEAETRARAGIFHNNVRLINAHNRRNLPYTLTANHMADWTEAERLALLGRRQPEAERLAASQCDVYVPKGGPVPPAVDWRSVSLGGPQPEPGQVNPAPDQGTCGSCWTFGAAAAGEAAHYRKYAVLPHLSQQNLLDCTWSTGNTACAGGTDFLGFQWLLDHNGGKWADQGSYGGYLNQDGFCHYALDVNLTTNPWSGEPVAAGATLQSCTHVTVQYNFTEKVVTDDEAVANLTDALANVGVLSVSIDATQPTFYFYEQGWYYDDKCKNLPAELDHIVTAVGYETGPDGYRYTIVRNSWSSHWGMNGFVKMSMKDNNCGVGTAPAFVTVA